MLALGEGVLEADAVLDAVGVRVGTGVFVVDAVAPELTVDDGDGVAARAQTSGANTQRRRGRRTLSANYGSGEGGVR